MVSYQDQQRSAIQYWLFFSDIETFLILVPSKKLEKSQNRKALFLKYQPTMVSDQDQQRKPISHLMIEKYLRFIAIYAIIQVGTKV